MRIVFIQHGDYREAAARFAAGDEETYYAQEYSVDYVASLTAMAERVTVICVATNPSAEVTCTGVHTIGMRLVETGYDELIRLVEDERPTHLITRSPMLPLIDAALRQSVRVFPILADSFRGSGVPARLRHWKIARTLNRPEIEWVGNHNLNASRDLARIGVSPKKIVPFDWPDTSIPEHFVPKSAPGTGSCRLIFAGHMSEQKGVGDILNAVRILRHRGLPATLTLVGEGKRGEFEDKVKALGLRDAVTFTGRITHSAVLESMRAHDAVIVASRHQYPEGQPNTLYDALVSRTPLVVSDHPMFVNKIIDGYSGAQFRASDPESLADTVQNLLSDTKLYETLSANAVEAAATFRLRALWGDVITHWLQDAPEDRQWLAEHTLFAYSRTTMLQPSRS